jgi:sulfite reductase (NADPH) hemoprotein beta-component
VGLKHRLGGDWDEDKWTGFRTRFGVYGQKQPGVQMLRIKIPGGVLSREWLTTLAEFNRRFCQGDVHITTRQDIQTYFVPLERTAEALDFLYTRGMTTREACGNTFRNITACALSGNCPREHVDAGKVAQQLATTWIRHPLVQNMPRKVKAAVSGCATDCAGVGFHDLGLVAIEKDGEKGFRVFVGGGLGSQPQPATEVLTFVTEEQLPTVMETLARLHQRYSDRVNRNQARVCWPCRSAPGKSWSGVSPAKPPSSALRWAWSSSMTAAMRWSAIRCWAISPPMRWTGWPNWRWPSASTRCASPATRIW